MTAFNFAENKNMRTLRALVIIIAGIILSAALLALDIHLGLAVLHVVGLLLMAIIVLRTKYVPKGDLL